MNKKEIWKVNLLTWKKCVHVSISFTLPEEEDPVAKAYYCCCAGGGSVHGVEDEAATLPTAPGAGWSGAASDAAGAGTIASVAAGTTATAAAVVAAAAPPPEAGTTVTVAAGTTAAAAPVAGAYTLLAVHVPHPQTHPSAPLGPSASSWWTSGRKPACRLVGQSPTPASAVKTKMYFVECWNMYFLYWSRALWKSMTRNGLEWDLPCWNKTEINK